MRKPAAHAAKKPAAAKTVDAPIEAVEAVEPAAPVGGSGSIDWNKPIEDAATEKLAVALAKGRSEISLARELVATRDVMEAIDSTSLLYADTADAAHADLDAEKAKTAKFVTELQTEIQRLKGLMAGAGVAHYSQH